MSDELDLFDQPPDLLERPSIRRLVHASPTATEVEAVTKVAPHLTAMKAAIMAAVESSGEPGLTPDEYADAHGLLINTVRRRFTDLWKAGQIRKNGVSRPNGNGNRSAAWVAVTRASRG